ncbi:MAG: hypothetical protein ACOCXJ_02775, partial [Planctomycetota bacterium]
ELSLAVATANNYLVDFAGIGGDFGIMQDFWQRTAPFIIACFAINFYLIWRGLNKGIEWFCKWAMPALIVCGIIILVRVLTLGAPAGAQEHVIYHQADAVPVAAVDAEAPRMVTAAGAQLVPMSVQGDVDSGVGFMWNPVGHRTVAALPVDADAGAEALPDGAAVQTAIAAGKAQRVVVEVGFWEALADPQTWLAAAGQIFFSLSVGLGVIVTYASYMRRDDDIALSSLTAASGNGFFEVALGGMLVIPAAFIFIPVGTIVDAGERASSLSLGFFALPGVFEHMPAGHFFGGLFFFLLFLAAVTSSLSMLQPAIAFLEEGLGLKRHASVTILGALTALGAAFVALISGNLVVLDHMDFWMANFAIFLLATVEVVLFAWVIGVDKGLRELSLGAEIPLPRWLPFLLKVVTPVFLIAIFVIWLGQQATKDKSNYFIALLENSTVQVTIGFMLLVGIFFALLVQVAVKRWQALEASGAVPVDPATSEHVAVEGGEA